MHVAGLRWKLTLILVLVIISIFYVLPTFFPVSEIKPRWLGTLLPKQKINLGLDLAGGVHIVMGVQKEATLMHSAERDTDFFKNSLKELASEVSYIPHTTHIKVVAQSEDQVDDIRKKVHDVIQGYKTESLSGKDIVFSFTREYEARLAKQAMDQTLERIRNRIDEFGVSEPSIQTQGSDRIVIQIPGHSDPKAAKEIIGKTAQLEFRLVEAVLTGTDSDGRPFFDPRVFKDEKTKQNVVLNEVVEQTQKEKNLYFKESGEEGKAEEKFSDYVKKINAALQGKIPANTMVLFEKEENKETGVITRKPYLMTSVAKLTGEYLKDAFVQMDEMGFPAVGFEFNSKGAKTLAELTRSENVGRQLAIILDGVVMSAPSIQTTLSNGKGIITLGAGSYETKQEESEKIAVVLRAGALPAPLDFLFESTVGPSLGRDSIQQSKLAMTVGALAVVIFILIYYQLSGVVAVLALFLNSLFILAVLAMLRGTLTLPGLAGITLTIGMAIDANIIIFERIREELEKGKTPVAALEAGFSHAWWPIFDSNLTTIIAGLVLLKYGTGPLKGFAVTLIIGLITNVFTSFYISKLIFAYFTRNRVLQRLSI